MQATTAIATITNNPALVNKKVNYKFGVYLNGEIVSERVFDADVYNPANRYKVDLRPFSHQIIGDFRNILNTPNQYLNTKVPVGLDINGNRRTYRLYEYQYQSDVATTKSGDGFKFALKVSDSSKADDDIIIERNFSVKNYNPNSVHSINIVYKVDDWVDEIKELMKAKDLEQMWNEYDLLQKTELNISDIRSLSNDAKDELLFKINNRQA